MKRFGGIILGVITLLAGSAPAAKVLYVDQNFQGEQSTGQSWHNAFSSVQDAIDAAADGGGEIWVKAGVYKPAGIKRKATFQLKPGVQLFGGFRGNETLRTQSNPRVNRTILSGDVGRIGSPADNCYHVVTGSARSGISGFIISAGNANGKKDAQSGAALLIGQRDTNFTAAHCTFEKNHATTGGAIAAAAAGTIISNCTFYANSAISGGAIHIENGGEVQISDCKFSVNFAQESGGAIALHATSKTVITRSWFLSNRTEGTGGAIAGVTQKNRGINLTLEKCEFIENSATENGGALFNQGAFRTVLSQCRFKMNVSKQGAGAIANRNGATTDLQDSTLILSRSAEGFMDVDDGTAPALAVEKPDAKQGSPPAESLVPKSNPKPSRPLADVFVYTTSKTKLELRSIVAKNDYTVLSTGELTHPEFLASYRTIEAAARDYSKNGVNFFYIYRYLSHPENHGYIQPFTLAERIRHIQRAKQLLHTQVPWLCDGIENEVVQALGSKTNNLFIFNKEGFEEFAGNVNDTDGLRKALRDLAGKINAPTSAKRLPAPDIEPRNMPVAQLVKRISIDPSEDEFHAVKIVPTRSRPPFYVKLRAEADRELLETGTGRLYLGFHIDPLYQMEWNNRGETLSYAITVPHGTAISPSINQAPKISGHPSDAEPREFLLDVRKWKVGIPVPITIQYSIHSDRSKSSSNISQQYTLSLEKDPFGGIVFGRQSSQE